jgi:serine phosphatase RsbU (regulator of sigma subunit)
VLRSIQVSLKLISTRILEMRGIAIEAVTHFQEADLPYLMGAGARERLEADETEQQRIEEELAIGHKIQLSLLPLCCPDITGWEFAAAYCPARYVGGDLYDFIQLPDEPHQLGLLIADVTGKGIPAALLMAFSRAVIRSESLNHHSPAAILQRTNHLIIEDVRYNMFLSAFYARLDAINGRLVYANGGHDWPLWFRAQSGEIRFLTTPGTILGMSRDAGLEERTVDISPGDILVFYTDGVTETRNPQGEFFGEQNLTAVVQANANAGAQDIGDAIYAAVVEFAETEPLHDDLALFIVKRCG